MVLAYGLKIDGQANAAIVGLPNALYLLPDETLATVSAIVIWCRTCRGFGAGERIEPRESTETAFAQATEGQLPEPLRFFISEPHEVARYRDSLRRTLHWQNLRRSPPRCLKCGGNDFLPIAEDGFFEELGVTIFSSPIFASTSSDNRLSLYDVEGHFLGEISRIRPDNSDFIDDACDSSIILKRLKKQNELPRRSKHD